MAGRITSWPQLQGSAGWLAAAPLAQLLGSRVQGLLHLLDHLLILHVVVPRGLLLWPLRPLSVLLEEIRHLVSEVCGDNLSPRSPVRGKGLCQQFLEFFSQISSLRLGPSHCINIRLTCPVRSECRKACTSRRISVTFLDKQKLYN